MQVGSLDTSLGVLLVGIFFNTYLYGIVTFQYASYHSTNFNDPAWIKLFVFSLFVLDTFHSASVIYMAWVLCVENFNNPEGLLGRVWPYPFTAIAISLTAFLTHMFLGYRIFRLTRSKVLYVFTILFSMASWVTGTFCGVYSWNVRSIEAVRSSVTVWLCLEVGADALITGILAIVLSRSRTGFHKSDTILNRLIRGSIQTGLFAGVFTILSLVLLVKSPKTQLFGMFGIPICRMYSNTLMDTLLVRHALRNTMLDSGGVRESQTDAIWLVNESKTPQSMMESSVRSYTRRETHTDVKTYNTKAHSQTSFPAIVEELRLPEHGCTKIVGEL